MLAQLINFINLFSETYLKSFIILLPLYPTSKILSTYTLHKDFKSKDISKVSITLELKKKYNNIEIDQISSEKVSKAVFKFADVLKKDFPQDALINFYNNVNEVKIRRNNLLFMLGADGVYILLKVTKLIMDHYVQFIMNYFMLLVQPLIVILI